MLPQLINRLDIRGAVMSFDAIGCQKKVTREVVKKGGYYVLMLKGNQYDFYPDVKLYLEDIVEGNFANIPQDYYQGNRIK